MAKEQIKVLFLDFDGVITTLDSHYSLDPKLIQRIKTITEKTNAKIVVSSSYKVGCENADEFRKAMNHRPNRTDTSDNMVWWLLENVYDVTDSSGSCRGDEIKRWLGKHPETTSYVIIDDDADFLDEQLFYFVQTDFFEGITEREEKLCIKVLNKEHINNRIRLNLELMTRWRNKQAKLGPDRISGLIMEFNSKENE